MDITELTKNITKWLDNGGVSTMLIIMGIVLILWSFCRWILQKMKLTPKDADRTMEQVDAMTGAQFEQFVAAVLEGNGYEIRQFTKAKQAMILANDNEVVGLWDRQFLTYMRDRAEKVRKNEKD